MSFNAFALGLNYVIKSNAINSTTVLAARDGITTVAKTVGLDLGNLLKFKPWGAVNLAKGINGALAFVGFALEAWDSWEQAKREEAFRKSIEDMVDNFNQQRTELLKLINGQQFIVQFFNDYIELQRELEDVQRNMTQMREQQQKFQEWHNRITAIDAEFKVLQN